MQTFRWSVVLGLMVAAGCSGLGGAGPPVTAPVPTAPPSDVPVDPTTSTLESTPPTDDTVETTSTTAAESPTSTEPEESTTTTAEPGGFLPADLGTPVDSAPGIDSPGEIVEMIDNVWIFIPAEEDPDDANVIPPLPEDAEIIAAYAEAQAAYHEQASMIPMPPEPSPRVAATLADGGQRLATNIFQPKAAADQHLDLTDGIVLRPVVVADPRSDTEAFIFDCQFDGTVFVNADGTLADGETPGVREFPQIASVVKVDGEWIVERLTRDERACA